MLKSRGPKVEPWGSPDFTGKENESVPRNKYTGVSIIKIAMKPINITGKESKITKLMEKNVMGNDIKSTT
jgi:hypothetical protein